MKLPVFLVLFLFLSVVDAFSIEVSDNYNQLTSDKGLSSNCIFDLLQDAQGYMWFSGASGLDMYDGLRYEHYDLISDGSKGEATVLIEDNASCIWAGGRHALFKQLKPYSNFIPIDLGIQDICIYDIFIGTDSLVYLASSKGVYILNEKGEIQRIIAHELDADILQIYVDKDGFCWMGTSKGFYCYNKKSLVHYSCVDLFPNNQYSFTSLAYADGSLYLSASSKGIVVFDLQSKSYTWSDHFKHDIVQRLFCDDGETVYVCCNGNGVHRFNHYTQKVETILSQEDVCGNAVYAMCNDRDNRQWFGTHSIGVLYPKNINRNFKLLSGSDFGLDTEVSVRSFFFKDKEHFFIGTRDGFISTDIKNQKTKVHKRVDYTLDELRSNVILSIYPYKDGLLLGTFGGGVSYYSYLDESIIPFPAFDEIRNTNVFNFASDSHGNLWVSTSEGLYCYNEENALLKYYCKRNSVLDVDFISNILIASDGMVWTGTDDGVFSYRFENGELVSSSDVVFDDNSFTISDLYEDSNGNIWVCTLGGGLSMIDASHKHIFTLDESDGLCDNSVSSIVETGSNDFWISTSNGLNRLNMLDTTLSSYASYEGVSSPVFTNGAMFFDMDNMLYIGSESGLLTLDVKNMEEDIPVPPIYISDVCVNGKDIDLSDNPKGFEIKHKLKSIRFRYVALSYLGNMPKGFEYMLEGYDTTWIAGGTSGLIHYYDLKHGDYVFKVKSSNSSTFSEISSFKVSIAYPLSVILILGILFIVIIVIIVYHFFVFDEDHDEIEENVKYSYACLSEARVLEITNEISHLIEDEKLFQDHGLKLSFLAQKIGCPTSELSQVFNKGMHISFNDYVNDFRIEEVKRLVNSGVYKQLTLMAIAQQSGFNSKTTFYRVFKRNTGCTPKEYIKKIEAMDSV